MRHEAPRGGAEMKVQKQGDVGQQEGENARGDDGARVEADGAWRHDRCPHQEVCHQVSGGGRYRTDEQVAIVEAHKQAMQARFRFGRRRRCATGGCGSATRVVTGAGRRRRHAALLGKFCACAGNVALCICDTFSGFILNLAAARECTERTTVQYAISMMGAVKAKDA